MTIKNIQASYQKEEDRLFLSFKIQNNDVLKFALTRRICDKFIDSAVNNLADNLLLNTENSNISKKLINPGVVPKVAPNSDILDDKFSAENFPLGKDYVLIVESNVILGQDNVIKLSFKTKTKKFVELKMPNNVFNDLFSLLYRVVTESNWHLLDVVSREKFIHNMSKPVDYLN